MLKSPNPTKPFRVCQEALGLSEDYTARFPFSFPLAEEMLAFPFCILSQKLLAVGVVCSDFCVFPSVGFRFN